MRKVLIFVKRGVVALLLTTLAMTTGLVSSQQAFAGTTCKTLNLSGATVTAIRPHMTVPICYNGSQVWQNGQITPGVDTLGYSLNGITWYGTYGGGGSWMGAGENYSVTIWGGWATFSCASRWGINAWGNVVSFDRGC